MSWLCVCGNWGFRAKRKGNYRRASAGDPQGRSGLGDRLVIVIMRKRAMCVRELGRPDEAKGHHRRALEVREADAASGKRWVATALRELARQVREPRRLRDAKGNYKGRALEISRPP